LKFLADENGIGKQITRAKACPDEVEGTQSTPRNEKQRKSSKLEIRNSKQIQVIKKAQNSKPTRFGFPYFVFGFVCFGLFRIFDIRILDFL
jgi:hypothetical protein